MINFVLLVHTLVFLYVLGKVHKQLVNNCPPFMPILSAIGTPNYNIVKFLVPILKPLTT